MIILVSIMREKYDVTMGVRFPDERPLLLSNDYRGLFTRR
jgi:hypothetical protein